MILQDVALQQLHVVLCIDRAGLVGEDGETHHGVFDVGYLRQVPGMTIFAPANYAELEQMLREAIFRTEGPVAVRYPRGKEGAYRAAAERDLIRDGGDLTILTYGTTVNAALDAAAQLAAQQVDAAVLKLRMLKPLVLDEVLASVRKTGRLLVVEEQNAPGSIYEAVVSQMAAQRIDPVVRALNLGDHYTTHGAVALLRHGAGIDADAIAAAAMEVTRIAT